MANVIRDIHRSGYSHVANFDLASFYDSIDHQVLAHFLYDFGVQQELVDLLLQCLKHWTSSTWGLGRQSIYHGHGIPQGPLPSGMLSEVVLQHIDKAGERGKRTRYIRYVDDIKIFAKSEEVLRAKLVALDLASRDIGLFPQTSKINLRRFVSPSDEVKSVSIPPEPSLTPVVDQKKLTKRILQLTRRGIVSTDNSTRFRYLLGRVNPSYRLNEKLIDVLTHHPEYAEAIATYISKYHIIPDKFADAILYYLRRHELYLSVNGSILRACVGRLSPAKTTAAGMFARVRLTQKGGLALQPSYKEALIASSIEANSLTFAELDAARSNESDWWVRKSILRELTQARYGAPSYAYFLNEAMRTNEEEISRCAAAKLVEGAVPLRKPYGNVSEHAKIVLKAAKIIKTVGKPASLINSILAYILKRPETIYDWRKFFGADHKHAELMAIFLKQSHESDIDAFMVRLDSFADKITGVVFSRLCSGKKYPNFGSAIHNPTMVAALPNSMTSFQGLHSLRLQSVTAHPRSQKSGITTRRLKHADFYSIRGGLGLAFNEFETIIAP